MEAYNKLEAAIIQHEMKNSVNSKAQLDALTTQIPDIFMALEIMLKRSFCQPLNIDTNNNGSTVNNDDAPTNNVAEDVPTNDGYTNKPIDNDTGCNNSGHQYDGEESYINGDVNPPVEDDDGNPKYDDRGNPLVDTDGNPPDADGLDNDGYNNDEYVDDNGYNKNECVDDNGNPLNHADGNPPNADGLNDNGYNNDE